jgi:hypothetical protein
VTISIDQWAISTHSVHNTAPMAAMQGRAVAAAASGWSVHTSAPSTAPVSSWAMSVPPALLATPKHQPHSNAEGRTLRVLIIKNSFYRKIFIFIYFFVCVFRVTRFTAENIHDVVGLLKSGA